MLELHYTGMAQRRWLAGLEMLAARWDFRPCGLDEAIDAYAEALAAHCAAIVERELAHV